ncbi:MAG TPA: YjbQ family protein [Syntrophaceae bacterium]|nr:YjbQ family protein [Syntrophaceae bacterium]
MTKLEVKTSSQTEFIDITSRVQKEIQRLGISDGVCYLFVPHTTAGITINENADPSVKTDILMELDKLIPQDDTYKHLEGNAPAHVKASIIGCSETVFVEQGKLVLGTWQGIFFCEFDGPRTRRVFLKIIS